MPPLIILVLFLLNARTTAITLKFTPAATEMTRSLELYGRFKAVFTSLPQATAVPLLSNAMV